MIDVLPRYPEAQLRMRVNHIAPGKEITIIKPQGIASPRHYPNPKHLRFSDENLSIARFGSPSNALIEFVYERIRTWLNEDPLMWCQYGAKFKFEKTDVTFFLSFYPFVRP
jgi:hypothetical protein